MLQAVSLGGRGWVASVVAASALVFGAASAQASGVTWSVGVNAPVVTVGAGTAYPVAYPSGYPAGYAIAAPVARPPVYVQPAPVVVHRPPVYVQPAPVVMAPPAVAHPYGYAAYPAYGYGQRHHHHHRPHPHWGNWDRY